MQIVEKLIHVANQDYKKENLTITSSNNPSSAHSLPTSIPSTTTQRSSSLNKQPSIYSSYEGKGVLSNITNTYQNSNN
jgi:hypothetical protein